MERAYLVAFCAGGSEFVFGLHVSTACGVCVLTCWLDMVVDRGVAAAVSGGRKEEDE